MIFSRRLIEKILPEFKNIDDKTFIKAVESTGNELPDKDIHHHPKLENLVIGNLKDFKPHPDSDHMNVCEVVIDKVGTTKTIVCGASNLIKGKNIVVALKGCKLHDGRVIEEKELRGVMSQGMICSYAELTPLNNQFVSKHDSLGVMLFDDGEVGDTEVAKFLGLDDTLYEIEVPYSNRHDIEGALAFCQDISAYFSWDFKFPEIELPKDKELAAVIEKDDKICNSFSLAKIKNVNMNDSSWELKGLLINNCIKPLNNLLDRLNYITLLTNQATAAYDAKVFSNLVKVNLANNGEKFSGFNGALYDLNDKDIVVRTTEENKIACLAGILGNDEFGVNSSTTEAYIEFANFNYVNIRKTAQRFDINTDAAKRNRKDIPVFTTLVALSLFTKEFASDLEGFKINGDNYTSRIYDIDYKYINSIIGSNLSESEIKEKLKALGFEIKGTQIFFPPWRNDLLGIPDLAEEIMKKIDINNELSEQPIFSNNVITQNKYTDFYFVQQAWDIMTNNYFNEIQTYNLTCKEELNLFNFFNLNNNVSVISPKPNRQWMRNNFIHQMLNVYKYNLNRKNDLIPVFEIDKVYQLDKREGELNLTLLTPAIYAIDKINKSNIIYNINGLKGVINQYVSVFNNKVTYEVVTDSPYCYEKECISINLNGEVIGYIGRIKDSLLKNYDIVKNPIYIATINLNKLIKEYKPNSFIAKPLVISPLMSLYKDLTFVNEGNKFMGETIKKALQVENVIGHEFIDKYEKDNSITYTFRFFFNNKNNLSNDEIISWMNNVIKVFEDDGFRLNR